MQLEDILSLVGVAVGTIEVDGLAARRAIQPVSGRGEGILCVYFVWLLL